mmetsp:Transcript_63308/g.141109  ORF Transcript_63308/g.141109 Transcript_63308/m.141109 type:complete len:239 (-) Transcript_63308:216-932(-)
MHARTSGFRSISPHGSEPSVRFARLGLLAASWYSTRGCGGGVCGGFVRSGDWARRRCWYASGTVTQRRAERLCARRAASPRHLTAPPHAPKFASADEAGPLDTKKPSSLLGGGAGRRGLQIAPSPSPSSGRGFLKEDSLVPPECDQSVSTAASVSLIRTGIGSASRPDAGGAKLGACVREGGLRAESAEEATWSPLAAVVQMLPPPELPEAPPRCCPTLPRSLGGEPVEGGAGRRGDH